MLPDFPSCSIGRFLRGQHVNFHRTICFIRMLNRFILPLDQHSCPNIYCLTMLCIYPHIFCLEMCTFANSTVRLSRTMKNIEFSIFLHNNGLSLFSTSSSKKIFQLFFFKRMFFHPRIESSKLNKYVYAYMEIRCCFARKKKG